MRGDERPHVDLEAKHDAGGRAEALLAADAGPAGAGWLNDKGAGGGVHRASA